MSSTQRWRGYMQIAIQSASGRSIAHILEFSRAGGLLSTDHPMATGEQIQIEIDVDRSYEELAQAPDVLVFPAVITNAEIEEGSFGGEHMTFSFPPEVIANYWPWLDTLAPHHGMKPAAPTG